MGWTAPAACAFAAANFFPTDWTTAIYLLTHRSTHTASPLFSSPSWYVGGMHFLWHVCSMLFTIVSNERVRDELTCKTRPSSCRVRIPLASWLLLRMRRHRLMLRLRMGRRNSLQREGWKRTTQGVIRWRTIALCDTTFFFHTESLPLTCLLQQNRECA